MKEEMLIISISDKETKEAIKQAYEKGIIIEPHGAVGWKAYEKVKDKLSEKTILLETAHPAKFPEVLKEIGAEVPVPESLKDLDNKKEE